MVLIAAIDRHDRALAAVRRVLAGTDGGDARVSAGERDHVAAVHGQVLHALVVDQVRLRGIPRLHHRRTGGDDQLLRQAADAEREIVADVRARGDLDVLLHLRGEAAHFHLDQVLASGQRLDVEEAGGIGGGRSYEFLALQFRRHGGARDRAAGLILYVTAERAADLCLAGVRTPAHQ